MLIFWPEKCSHDNICVVALFETRRGNISALVEKMSPGTIIPRCDTLYKQSAVSYIHTASPSSSPASLVRLRLRLRLGQGGCGCQDGCGSLSYCHLPHLTGTHSAAAWWISTYLSKYLCTYLRSFYLVPLLPLS